MLSVLVNKNASSYKNEGPPKIAFLSPTNSQKWHEGISVLKLLKALLLLLLK